MTSPSASPSASRHESPRHAEENGTFASARQQEVEMVNLVIDDVEMSVPKGTLVIRAAELLGVQIPRFCDHPLLDPVGACRQCLVEVEGQRKPMASCTTPSAKAWWCTPSTPRRPPTRRSTG